MIKEETFKGINASPGISTGKAYLYTRNIVHVSDGNVTRGDLQTEIAELNAAIELSKKELTKIYNLSLQRIGEENSKIFEAQIDFLNDSFFFQSINNKILTEKKSADYVFDKEVDKISASFLNSDDEYIRERYNDMKDIKIRVLRNMKREKLVSKVEENSIIIAHELSPADTILFNKRKVMGYATDTGGITSHTAIISRALRVPAIVGMKNISKVISTGDDLIIDGYLGVIIKNPSPDTIRRYNIRVAELNAFQEKLNKVIDLPSETLDGRKVELNVNIEFDEEVNFVTSICHCSIGLYRTEHLFIEKGDFPSEQEQIEEYSHISKVTYPNSVTIRTYDIGGDKLLPGSHKEDNPFLGWRGIRICLDRVEIFKEQLRAILISSSLKNLKLMFPLIISLDEIRKAKQILNSVKKQLIEEYISFDKDIKIGMMIETPSACILADEFAKEVDFFSIGTNDLIMYTLAVDRGNDLIADLYQDLHPAILRSINHVIEAGHRNNILVSVCGEMASDPIATPLLVGLGVDELSVSPGIFPQIKQIIRQTNYEESRKTAQDLLKLTTELDIRKVLEEINKDKE
ncbi:phosphoenolpyruvate--protein phosphotransferase [soil metagenome]